jgi:demethylmenaquinone methyltransferase / 2-methoxy-6-polyprenyl-1,4-benzoquinol methylase
MNPGAATNPLEGDASQEVRGGSGAMFDRIANRYDLINRLISLGIDQRWRKRTVRGLELGPNARVLDVATGTGDLAIMVARSAPGISVTGLDPSEQMLAIGRKKVEEAKLTDRVTLVHGDAQALPFESQSFDGVCIAFGIRNVPDRPLALKEMARVLKPGARLAVLELSEPKSGFLAPFARFHVHTVVPWLGSLLSGAREYRYLERSIAAFPDAAVFCEMMREAGFEPVTAQPQSFGACHVYIGVRSA